MEKLIGWRRFSIMVLLLVFVFVLKLRGVALDEWTAGTIVACLGAYLGMDLGAKLKGIIK